jgi:hypothetical protein
MRRFGFEGRRPGSAPDATDSPRACSCCVRSMRVTLRRKKAFGAGFLLRASAHVYASAGIGPAGERFQPGSCRGCRQGHARSMNGFVRLRAPRRPSLRAKGSSPFVLSQISPAFAGQGARGEQRQWRACAADTPIPTFPRQGGRCAYTRLPLDGGGWVGVKLFVERVPPGTRSKHERPPQHGGVICGYMHGTNVDDRAFDARAGLRPQPPRVRLNSTTRSSPRPRSHKGRRASPISVSRDCRATRQMRRGTP